MEECLTIHRSCRRMGLSEAASLASLYSAHFFFRLASMRDGTVLSAPCGLEAGSGLQFPCAGSMRDPFRHQVSGSRAAVSPSPSGSTPEIHCEDGIAWREPMSPHGSPRNVGHPRQATAWKSPFDTR